MITDIEPTEEATKEQIDEFNQALEGFYHSLGYEDSSKYMDLSYKHSSNKPDLRYQKLLETNVSLRKYFEEMVLDYAYQDYVDKINILFEHDKTLFSIKDKDDENILQILIKNCDLKSIDFITKYINQFTMGDELKNKLISDQLFYGDGEEENQHRKPKACIEIIKILFQNGVKISDKDLQICDKKEIFIELVKHAEDPILKSGLCLILEKDSDEYEIEKIKYLHEEKKVVIDEFKSSKAQNNYFNFIFNRGNEETKTSFLKKIFDLSPDRMAKFFEGLSEENLSLILEKKNESGVTLLLNLLREHILEPSDENKEKIKYIFKKQFKRDLKDEEIPDFVEFTKTYNFFNLFYDKDGQYMYDQSFKSTLLFYLPEEEDLQDDLSKQLLKIYQQIAKKEVADITCKDDGKKETHLYSYRAKLKSHSSYFIFHVNDENKLTKISYCDGYGIPEGDAAAIDKHIYGATTFLLREPQDFNDKFAQDFIKKNSEGKKVSDFHREFYKKIKRGKIFDYELSTITKSIPTKIQTRSNCALKSANILARFFLEQQNQYLKPHQSSLFILDPADGKVIGEGNKAYKDLKESMSQKVDKKLIEDVKKVPDDFVRHIELYERTNNKWKQVRVKEQKINEFDEALQSFDKDPNNLRYRELLEGNHSLFDCLKKVVAKYIVDGEFKKINILLENSKISDPIFEFEFENEDAYNECFHGTILTHSVIACNLQSLDLIDKHISKFKLGKDHTGDNLLSLLMRGAINQEGDADKNHALRFCIEISKILINHEVSVDDKNNDGKTPIDFCFAPELFKILANHASQETLEKNLRCNIENKDWEEMWGLVSINIKFLLTEKNVKIDGFLDWNFSCPTLKNNFTEFVCKNDNIKESFLEQLSTSNQKQRDKFFEGLSEENLSLIKEKLEEQLSKQQELQLIVNELKEHEKKDEKKDDKYGFKKWYSNPSLCFSTEIINKNAEFLKDVINGSDAKKNSFMEVHCSASSDQRMAFLSGLKPECINFILEKAKERLDSLKKHNEILEKLKHLTNPREGIPSSSDGPKVGSKRLREGGVGETEIKITSCEAAVKPPPLRASSW